MSTVVTVAAYATGSDNASAGTVKITVPAGTQAGQLLIAYTSSAWSVSAPTGWNNVAGTNMGGTNISGGAFWKIATSTDAGTVVNFPLSGGTGNGIMVVLNGANTAIAPVGAAAYSAGGATNNTQSVTLNSTSGGAYLYFGGLRTSGGTNYVVSGRGSLVGYDTSVWSASAYFEQFNGTPNLTDTWTNVFTSYELAMVQVASSIVDDFPGAPLTAVPSVFSASFPILTLQSGEPGSGTNSAWFYVDATKSTRYLLSTVGSPSDTIIEVYTGADLTHLTLLTSDDDSGGSGTSRLVVDLAAGTRYYFRVALKTGTTAGNFTFKFDYDNRWKEEVLKDSPQLMWDFDMSSVSAFVPDLSGNSRIGSWSQQNEYNLEHAQPFTAFKGFFRGNYANYVDSASITWPASGSITVEALVYFDEFNKATMLFSWPSTHLDFLYGHSSAVGYMGLNNGVNSVSGPPQPTAGWHHLAFVFALGASSTTAKYYIDGVLQTAAFGGSAMTLPTTLGSQAFRIGHWTGGWEIPEWVRITGVAVFFGELTQARIQAHYQAAFGLFSDSLANAQVILPIPSAYPSLKAPFYDSSTWTTDAGEPLSDPVTRTAWAVFDAPIAGTYQLDTIGSTYDTSATVYTGSPGALALVASDSSSGGSNNAKVIWTATAGTRYYLQVGASAGASPDSGTIYPRFGVVSVPGNGVTPVYYASSELLPRTGFLLKGRSTKDFDAQPGG